MGMEVREKGRMWGEDGAAGMEKESNNWIGVGKMNGRTRYAHICSIIGGREGGWERGGKDQFSLILMFLPCRPWLPLSQWSRPSGWREIPQ